VFCIYLRTNSDLCHLQHKLIGFYNRDEKCLQRGTDLGFKQSSLRFVFKGLICIYVFCIYLRTNSDLCHLQHKLIGLYNRDEKCLQHGTDWGFKQSSLRFVFKGLICIYVFCNYLRTNSDLCHLQHKLIGFYNRDEKYLQRGTDWGFK